MSKFSDKLQSLIDKKGWSPTRLATLTGLGFCSISRYLDGRTKPSIKSLEKICEVLHVSPDYLLFDEEEDIL